MDRASFLTGEFRHALDDRGRVAVPARFRGRLAAGATLARWLGEVVVVGALNRLEIWSPAAWQPYRAKIEDEPEALAEHLADLGI